MVLGDCVRNSLNVTCSDLLGSRIYPLWGSKPHVCSTACNGSRIVRCSTNANIRFSNRVRFSQTSTYKDIYRRKIEIIQHIRIFLDQLLFKGSHSALKFTIVNFWNKRQKWQYWHKCQLCTPIPTSYLLFSPFFALNNGSKCKIRITGCKSTLIAFCGFVNFLPKKKYAILLILYCGKIVKTSLKEKIGIRQQPISRVFPYLNISQL